MKQNVAKLGEAVAARRHELNMSQVDVWQSGGPSNSTLTGIEKGVAETVSAVTQRKLDLALKWEPGSAQRVLAGRGDPTPIPEGGTPVLDERRSRETTVVGIDGIADLAYQAQLIRKRFMFLDPADLEPEEWEDLLRDSVALALEIEAFAMRAVGPSRLKRITDGRLGPIRIELPPLPDEMDDTPPRVDEYGLAARETPPGYRKGKPTPDE